MRTVTYEENGCANIVDAIGKQNKNLGEVVRSWHKSLMATYPNSKTRKSKLSRLNRFLRWTGYGPLTADLRRIEDFFGGLPTDTSLEERQGLQSVLRQFLAWRGLSKEKWPAVLNGRMHGPRKQLTRDDLLTFEEVQALVDAGENPRDRAFMAVLYDTGAMTAAGCPRTDRIISDVFIGPSS